jgi:hypothetical protein
MRELQNGALRGSGILTQCDFSLDIPVCFYQLWP